MYNEKSCNALEKPFYTPVEAAIRWCGLIAHEADILSSAGVDPVPAPSAFPQWPCLRANAEKILDAVINGDVVYGRDGKTVARTEHVARHRLTIRHSDLKQWMAEHYPDQKPAFLFDEVERSTHAAITVEAFQALQAERDALKSRIEKAERWYQEVGRTLESENAQLAAKVAQAGQEISSKSKNAYLRTIAALGHALIGGTTGKPHSDAAAILAALAPKGIEAPIGSDALANYLREAGSV